MDIRGWTPVVTDGAGFLWRGKRWQTGLDPCEGERDHKQIKASAGVTEVTDGAGLLRRGRGDTGGWSRIEGMEQHGRLGSCEGD